MTFHFGLWRRLVARSLGVGEVGGSNPLSPIRFMPSRLYLAELGEAEIGLTGRAKPCSRLGESPKKI